MSAPAPPQYPSQQITATTTTNKAPVIFAHQQLLRFADIQQLRFPQGGFPTQPFQLGPFQVTPVYDPAGTMHQTLLGADDSQGKKARRGASGPKRGEYKCGKCGHFPKKEKHNCHEVSLQNRVAFGGLNDSQLSNKTETFSSPPPMIPIAPKLLQ